MHNIKHEERDQLLRRTANSFAVFGNFSCPPNQQALPMVIMTNDMAVPFGAHPSHANSVLCRFTCPTCGL